jgi:hypothetical protein
MDKQGQRSDSLAFLLKAEDNYELRITSYENKTTHFVIRNS